MSRGGGGSSCSLCLGGDCQIHLNQVCTPLWQSKATVTEHTTTSSFKCEVKITLTLEIGCTHTEVHVNSGPPGE